METVSEALVSQCISVLRKDIGIAQFESWLYEYSELLEEELDYNTYLELININYTSKFAMDELKPILLNIAGYHCFEEFEIKDILQRLHSSDEECINCCRRLYYYYCEGYSFLRIFALKFIVWDYDLQLNDRSLRERFIKENREQLIDERQRIVRFLQAGKIEFVSSGTYIDKRSEQEKLEERY